MLVIGARRRLKMAARWRKTAARRTRKAQYDPKIVSKELQDDAKGPQDVLR